jgi:hypothetical protein
MFSFNFVASQASNASTISPISQTRDVPFADVVHTAPLACTPLTLITMKSPACYLTGGTGRVFDWQDSEAIIWGPPAMIYFSRDEANS